jgi:hypothetical protein
MPLRALNTGSYAVVRWSLYLSTGAMAMAMVTAVVVRC